MPRKGPLSAPVVAEIPKRLHDAAEAFYFAAVLSSAWFYGRGAAPNQHSSVERALDGILISGNKHNQVGAPPLVNFAFSIELYIKLLRFLADGQLMQGHNLHALFLEFENVAPDAGAAAIRCHRSARGDRDEFLEYLDDTKSVFEDWRYAYEKEFLIASPDSVQALADAFRAAMEELHPGRKSIFSREADADEIRDHTGQHGGEGHMDAQGRLPKMLMPRPDAIILAWVATIAAAGARHLSPSRVTFRTETLAERVRRYAGFVLRKIGERAAAAARRRMA